MAFFGAGGGMMARFLRFGALVALCALVGGCDPCGGSLKFNKFPGVCSYEQAK
jgi:hypothetical protein